MVVVNALLEWFFHFIKFSLNLEISLTGLIGDCFELILVVCLVGSLEMK